jgi:hypothetical protein
MVVGKKTQLQSIGFFEPTGEGSWRLAPASRMSRATQPPAQNDDAWVGLLGYICGSLTVIYATWDGERCHLRRLTSTSYTAKCWCDLYAGGGGTRHTNTRYVLLLHS